jgi:hypothetical protein
VPDHGVDLGVDLYKLLVVAKDDLPSVSAIYGDAVAAYNRARSGLDAAMQRPDHFGASPGPVHDAWTQLFDTAVKFLSDTHTNLDATAAALTKAVDMYAATDKEAADKFHSMLNERGEPKPGPVK